VGFKLRRDSPIELKEAIVRLQSRTHEINNKQSDPGNSESSTNERLRFMIESINAIKNNDVRRLGSESASLSDQDAIEHIRKQMRVMLKDGGSGGDQTLLNVTYSDLIKSDELGRWWIVGSAWNLKENERNGGGGDEDKKATKADRNGVASNGVGGEMFSEKILKLAREQHMNTDIRRSIFCILVSAEVYDFNKVFHKC
jgi:nucleolar MIF4G domain-containing protein 1